MMDYIPHTNVEAVIEAAKYDGIHGERRKHIERDLPVILCNVNGKDCPNRHLQDNWCEQYNTGKSETGTYPNHAPAAFIKPWWMMRPS